MLRALVLAPFSQHHLDRLRRSLDVAYESWLDTRLLSDPNELACRLKRDDITVLVVEADFVFEETFQHADSLKFVGSCRNATGHIDVDAATRRGVVVVNTPGRNAQAVAEHVLGLMLSLARRIPAAHRYVTEGRWQNPAEPYISMRGVELAGRTLGVIGLGSIGARLAQLGSALGMKVVAHDPYIKRPPAAVTLVDLDELMARSDFVIVQVPLTEETEALIDAPRLAIMKPTAYLVNASDAAVVDQEALTEALYHRRIAGAALDVFETHPLQTHSPLLTLDNVVLTPHLAGATQETVERHSRMMTADILRFLKGQRPKNLVNPEAWDRRG